MEKTARATKKQRELLVFIDGFIKGNGYGPSYRETMRALGYRSVSTVAVHVDGLVAAGYLRKRDRSARSIEVVHTDTPLLHKVDDSHARWLQQLVSGKLADDTVTDDDKQALRTTLEILDIPLHDEP
ncbi:MAG: hypothetical protein WAS27_01865 [Candidatus Saccharimonadales bacterium]